jgi:hypothetical protein
MLLGMSVGSQASNLVLNPGFETGDFSNWTQFGNTGNTAVDTVPHTGSFDALFGPVGSLGGITQALPTIAGASYSLQFWLQNDGGTPNEFLVQWDGTTVIDTINAGGFGFTLFAFTQVASSTSTQLSFSFRQDPNFFSLDDISVDLSAVPEPSTIAMFGSGLLALALWRRRRA